MELIEHWISTYGYLGVFILLVGGIVGLPIPDEMLLLFVGYQVYLNKMSFSLSLLSAFAGALIGVSLSYMLGKRFGLPLLLKVAPKIHLSERKIEKAQALFQKYGLALLFIGFFLPGVRHLTGFFAGVANIRFWKFAVFAYSGALMWVTLFVSMGQLLGKRWLIVSHYFEHPLFLIAFLLSITFFVIAFFALRKTQEQ